MTSSQNKRITVVGAGGGGCAAAAELTQQGYDITLFNRGSARIQPIIDSGGVRLCAGSKDEGLIELANVTDDPAQALKWSDTAIVLAPTSALGTYADLLADHLTNNHRILLAPGHTGGAMYFSRRLRAVNSDLTALIGETHTLPFICRKTGPAEVTVWSHAKKLLAAAIPAGRTDELMGIFAPLLPAMSAVDSVLETSLSNHNAVMHPAGMILNAGWIESTAGGFFYYADGHSPAVSRVIEAVDEERLRIGRSLGVTLPSFLDAFYAAGATSESAWKSGSVERAISESEPNKLIKAPGSLDDRYVHEDFGYGLVPFKAFADAAGVSVPVISSLIDLAEAATGFPLSSQGLNAERLGIDGLDANKLHDLVM